MNNTALVIGVSYDLLEHLSKSLISYGISTAYALTIKDGIQMFSKSEYHLILIDVQCIHETLRKTLLYGLRCAQYIPILVLMDSPWEEEGLRLLDHGVDLCLSQHMSADIIGKHIYSLIRRYTAYNHYNQPEHTALAPFICGDIFIDPMRRSVHVQDRAIHMRPREFSLLLYFMQNPNIVLTAEQICECAWGKEEGYGRGVGQPIRELRKLIEPNPREPVYIVTVHSVGYRFVACRHESCDLSQQFVVSL